MKEIIGSSVLLLGYGQEGKATHRYLMRYYPQVKIGIADKKEIKPLNQSVELQTGKDYLKSLCNYSTIVRSPGISFYLPELERCFQKGKKVTSGINIFFSECPGVIIGVTGTKGKSTTSSLIAHILKEKYSDVRLVGNIGLPVLDFLPKSNSKTVFVVELSSAQLQDIHYNPHIVVLLAIVPEHLDYHKSFAQYVEAKRQIVRYQTSDDFTVFNPSHRIVNQLVSNSPSKKCRFSLVPRKDAEVYLDKETIFIKKDNDKPYFLLHRNDIPLLGEGNVENTLAAICVGLILNVPLRKIQQTIPKFKPLEHRIEFVGEFHGIRFYNDSIATIPEATINAIKALGDNVETLIAGGHERGLNFAKLGKFLRKSKVRFLVLFPPTGERIWQSVCKFSPKEKLPRKYEVSTMEEAVRIAFEKTTPGKICLLSPASASFGLFRDFKERGSLFKKLVSEWKG